jgi:hypothetical protein
MPPLIPTAIELRRIMRSTWPVARPERMLPQPGGLPDGSRGSARGARTPGTRDGIVSTPEGCQNPGTHRRASTLNSVCCCENDVEDFLGVWNGSAMRRLCHPSGVKSFFHGGPGVGARRSDPRLPSGNPPGCEDPPCSCKNASALCRPHFGGSAPALLSPALAQGEGERGSRTIRTRPIAHCSFGSQHAQRRTPNRYL